MVADPYHLLDCAINSEGGAGLVLTTAERAADLGVQPIYLLGGAIERQGMAYVAAPVWDRYGWSGRRAAQRAFAQCGLAPADVDVCEFYDPFSFELIRQLEAFGFCKEGEGGDFVMGGRIEIDGECPLVTNGGLLSFSHPAPRSSCRRSRARCSSSARLSRRAHGARRDGRDDEQRRRGRAVLRRDAARQGAGMSAGQIPLPRPTELSRPHWDGCRDGVLRYQRCRDCGAAVFIPQPVCTGCFGDASSGSRARAAAPSTATPSCTGRSGPCSPCPTSW